jgi:hypothetical protein
MLQTDFHLYMHIREMHFQPTDALGDCRIGLNRLCVPSAQSAAPVLFGVEVAVNTIQL